MADCRLLLNFNGTDEATSAIDEMARHTVAFHGTAQIDTAVKKFGVGSLMLDGDSDYLSIPTSSDFNIFSSTTANRTLELWVKHTDHAGSEIYVQHYQDDDNRWGINHVDGSGLLFYGKLDGASFMSTGYCDEITDTPWHHIAVCIVGDTIGLYLDGQQIGYDTISTTATFPGSLLIGRHAGSPTYFDGHIDGVALWHSNKFNASPNAGKTDTIDILNPLAHYKLDDDAANTTVADSSGNANTGTSTANTSSMSVTGQIDSALQFDAGSSEEISVSNFEIVSSDTDRSISLWTKVSDGQTSENPGFFEGGNNIYVYTDDYGNSGSKTMFALYDGSTAGSVQINNEDIFDGEWHHIVCVVSRTDQKMHVYIDGSISGSDDDISDVGDTSGAQTFYIGSRGGNQYLDGVLDDLQWYMKALTAAEVLSIYNAGLAGEIGVTQEYEAWELLHVFPSITGMVDSMNYGRSRLVDSVRRSDPMNGYVIRKARFTWLPKRWRFRLRVLTETDMDNLQTFEESIEGGERAFVWNDTRKETSHVVWLDKSCLPLDFKMEPKSCDRWNCDIVLNEHDTTEVPYPQS